MAADPEEMTVSELKQAFTKARIRSDHCVEKADLIELYKQEFSSGRPRPAVPQPTAATTPAPAPAPAPARAPAPAPTGGGTYVNGRYQPPPKGMFDNINTNHVLIGVVAIAWLYTSMGSGGSGGGMDIDGDDYDVDDMFYAQGKVMEVVTHSDFQGVIAHHRDNTGLPVVVDFFSHSCGPCRMIAPAYKRIAKEFKGKAVFLKVDVNRNYGTSQAAGIRSMP
eukprot:SAG31_NODE_13317_length_877_cov_1.519280_1_plen_221_part_01